MKATKGGKKKNYREHLTSVRIETDIVDLVKEYKKTSFMPVGKFFGVAAQEKLQSQTIKK